MVRTRAGPTKVSAGKAPSKQRAIVASEAGSSSSSSKHNQSFGNSYHPRETPTWQKTINSFFNAGSTNTANMKTKEINEDSSKTLKSAVQENKSKEIDVNRGDENI